MFVSQKQPAFASAEQMVYVQIRRDCLTDSECGGGARGASAAALSAGRPSPSACGGPAKEADRVGEASFFTVDVPPLQSFLPSFRMQFLPTHKCMKKYPTVRAKILRGLKKKNTATSFKVYYIPPIVVFEYKKVRHLHEKVI